MHPYTESTEGTNNVIPLRRDEPLVWELWEDDDDNRAWTASSHYQVFGTVFEGDDFYAFRTTGRTLTKLGTHATLAAAMQACEDHNRLERRMALEIRRRITESNA